MEKPVSEDWAESEGPDIGLVRRTWVNIAASEARLKLLKDLEQLDIGFKEVEDYAADLRMKFRSKTLQGDIKSERKVVTEAMRTKLRDEKLYHGELTRERNQWRRAIKDLLGESSKTTRSVIKYLRGEAKGEKTRYKEKYDEKLKHLKKKFKKTDESKLDDVPKDLLDYEDLRIFSEKMFKTIEKEEIEITCIGEVRLSKEEKEILRLQPKFALLKNLDEDDLEWDRELGFGKLRYELGRENDEELEDEIEMTEEEAQKLESLENKTRQVFDPETKTFDFRKQRVTDIEDNVRVTLPKPLKPPDEAAIEMRREIYRKLEADYRREKCDKNGKQPTNLTKTQEIGLKKLKKRIKDGEIHIMKTDKSNKFAVTTLENYIEMGQKHIRNDREVSYEEITEREKILNGHSSMWIKMWGVCEAHDQVDRVRGSRITHSRNVAKMTLLLKDHKLVLDTRGLVTGNTSNTRAMSIMTSQVVESLADSISSVFELVSTEDLLAKINNLNNDIIRLHEKNGRCSCTIS